MKRTQIFFYLCLVSVIGTSFFSQQAYAQNKPSLASTETLCIGNIISDPLYVVDFKQYLQTSLTNVGFHITNDPAQCDATLMGHLKVSETTRKKKLAWAWMELRSNSNQVLWKDEFHPSLTICSKGPNFIKNDGRSGVAANLAKRLSILKTNRTP